MKWSFGAAAGLAAVLAFAGPAAAAVDAFLQLDGVPGESQDANHKDQIELTSWSMGVQGGRMAAESSGRAGGRANVSDIHITKAQDKASPLLMQAAATGRHFKTATLYARKAGEEPYLVYKLTDVMISSYQLGSGGGGHADESMSLNFTKIETLNHPQTAETAVTRAGMVPRASRLPPPGP